MKKAFYKEEMLLDGSVGSRFLQTLEAHSINFIPPCEDAGLRQSIEEGTR